MNKVFIIGGAVVGIVALGALYYFSAPTAVAPISNEEVATTTPEITPESPAHTETHVQGSGDSPNGQNIAPTLTGGGWTWQYTKHTDGTKTTSKDTSRFVLTFETDGRAHSTTDCNSVSTSYALKNTALTFSAMASTLMFCTDTSQETLYTSDLAKATSYTIVSNELDIKLSDGSTMVFIRPLKINQ